MFANRNRPPLVIDMISDFVCPWCYVGFRALGLARLALSPEFSVTVRYRPYRLDPATPPEGLDRNATLARKFPDPEHRRQIADALYAAQAEVGLRFDPSAPQWLPDTTNAHRLARWAAADGDNSALIEAIFAAYWQGGHDLGVDDLVAIAAATGFESEDLAARLESAADRDDLAEEAASYRAGGVTGVPTFIVNEQVGFAGALPPAALVAELRTLAAETSPPDDDDD